MESLHLFFVIIGVVEGAGKKGCVSGNTGHVAKSYGLNAWTWIQHLLPMSYLH